MYKCMRTMSANIKLKAGKFIAFLIYKIEILSSIFRNKKTSKKLKESK